jgi:hypothetical protein
MINTTIHILTPHGKAMDSSTTEAKKIKENYL